MNPAFATLIVQKGIYKGSVSTVLISGIIAGYTINLPFMLGEELGWRGLMTEETRGLGFWKSNLLIGAV